MKGGVNGVFRHGYDRQKDITIEEVKACGVFAHFSDEEAQQVVDALRRFTEVVFDCYKRRQLALQQTSDS